MFKMPQEWPNQWPLIHVALASPKCPTLDLLLFSLMPDELSVFSSHFGPWTLALGLSHSPGEITLLSSVAIPWPCHLHTCDEVNTQLCPHLAPLFFFFYLGSISILNYWHSQSSGQRHPVDKPKEVTPV